MKDSRDMEHFSNKFSRTKSVNYYPRSELHKMQRMHRQIRELTEKQTDEALKLSRADHAGEINIY